MTHSARKPPRLLDRVRATLRVRHYSRRTEDAYVGWIRRYIRYHGIRHPDEMGSPDVVEFLPDLAVRGRVAASTQSQALAALLFLYRDVLGRDLADLDRAVRARRPRHVPVVLSRDEVRALFSEIEGPQALAARLMYGSGLRLLECLRLRVHDVEPGRRQIVVRQGKGQRDRTTVFPRALESALARHLERAKQLYQLDHKAGNGGVELPSALARKYPQAPYDWGWFWVFPATKLSTDPRSGSMRRHHLHESAIQRAIRGAALRAGIEKRVSPHTLRHYSEPRTITQ